MAQPGKYVGLPTAKDELAIKEPENTGKEPAPIVVIGSTGNGKSAKTKSAAKLQPIKHSIKKSETSLAGNYTGYIIRYDWSGQHVLSKSSLNLSLQGSGDAFNGSWDEGAGIATALQARLTDTSVIFNNTGYARKSHYSNAIAEPMQFKNASLQLIKTADSVYLVGNLQLYSTMRMEPDKPIYISLVKTPATKKPLRMAATKESMAADGPAAANIRPKGLVVYPNPFESSFEAAFFLEKAEKVTFALVDMGGRVMYSKSVQMEKGPHVQAIQAELVTGAYVFKLAYGRKVQTSVVIKQ